MSLPFNSYNQLRYRGNEYVTDQTLNRTVYRLFQNDVYLDEKLLEHVSDNSVHYAESDTTIVDYLTSDKLVILSGKKTGETENYDIYEQTRDILSNANTQTYSEKSWQRLIDEQPRNLGGNTLTFRFQRTQTQSDNPYPPVQLKIFDTIRFKGFYGGNLIIESQAAFSNSTYYQTSTSALNQNLIIKNMSTPKPANTDKAVIHNNSDAVISLENCHCKVLIRNSRFMISDIIFAKNIGNNGEGDFSGKLENNTHENGIVYSNFPDNDGRYECKRFSVLHNKWYDMNILAAIKVTDTPDLEINHCYIEY
jgi:hypothetical protein